MGHLLCRKPHHGRVQVGPGGPLRTGKLQQTGRPRHHARGRQRLRIESRIKRAEDRETLFDVSNLKAELAKQYDPQSPEMLVTAKILSNLLRRFS